MFARKLHLMRVCETYSEFLRRNYHKTETVIDFTVSFSPSINVKEITAPSPNIPGKTDNF
jgi:hypothetical protein